MDWACRPRRDDAVSRCQPGPALAVVVAHSNGAPERVAVRAAPADRPDGPRRSYCQPPPHSGLLSPLPSAAGALMAKRRSSRLDGTFARARTSLFPGRPPHPRQRTCRALEPAQRVSSDAQRNGQPEPLSRSFSSAAPRASSPHIAPVSPSRARLRTMRRYARSASKLRARLR